MTKGYSRSIVMSIIGNRGSGKSLFLTAKAVEALLHGKTVWSNMPIKLNKYWSDMYGVPKLKALPLDLDAFYSLSGELQDGVVCIDEAQNMSDSRTSLTLKNRLLNAIMAQVRKRDLNVYYTVQDPDWVDLRLRFATDVQASCFDLGYSPWGRTNQIDYGKRIRLKFKDLSGYVTGKSFYDTGRYYHTTILKGDYYWTCYDTKKVVDLEEAFSSVKLNLKQRIVGGNKEEDINQNIILNNAWKSFKKIGNKIPNYTVKETIKKLGIDMSPQQMGRLMPRGVKRSTGVKGMFYDFSNAEV